ncbi:hypothetical protein GGR54DRAFT_546906 [Hypoxylon sp. NC1633]|nr:hypothetical protein GGR54DRAFT_546906 [Hypoxylon sp. NC1633]
MTIIFIAFFRCLRGCSSNQYYFHPLTYNHLQIDASSLQRQASKCTGNQQNVFRNSEVLVLSGGHSKLSHSPKRVSSVPTS